MLARKTPFSEGQYRTKSLVCQENLGKHQGNVKVQGMGIFFWLCPWPRPGISKCSDGNWGIYNQWKQLHIQIPSRFPRRRLYEPEAGAGLWHGPLLGRFKMVYCAPQAL